MLQLPAGMPPLPVSTDANDQPEPILDVAGAVVTVGDAPVPEVVRREPAGPPPPGMLLDRTLLAAPLGESTAATATSGGGGGGGDGGGALTAAAGSVAQQISPTKQPDTVQSREEADDQEDV